MENKHEFNNDLIVKFLRGKATPEEAMFLEEETMQSRKNKERLDQFEHILSVEGLPLWNQPNKETAWLELNLLLKKNSGQASYFTYRIAASILFLLSITGLIVFMLINKEEAKLITRQGPTTEAIKLGDGSSITLRSGAVLKYPAEFKNESREIELNGTAFFDVEHDPNRPFVISTSSLKIKVLGTAFNVHENKTGSITTTAVVRGKVLLYTPEKSLLVEAGMKGEYFKSTREFRLSKLETPNDFAYATHTLVFKNSNMKEITHQLESAYGVQFKFNNPSILSCRLTTEWRNKPLSFILSVISQSLDVSCELEDGIVQISGKGCE